MSDHNRPGVSNGRLYTERQLSQPSSQARSGSFDNNDPRVLEQGCPNNTTRLDPHGYSTPESQTDKPAGITPVSTVLDTERKFVARKQLLSQLAEGLAQWVLTVALICALFGTILHYKSRGAMSDHDTRIFNAINTGISIALGMTVASALKSMALNIRWRIVSQRARPLSEVDLFLQCDSLSTLAKMLLHLRRSIWRRPWVLLTVLFTLLLNLGAQIAVAAVTLTYSTQPTSRDAVIVPDSEVWATDLSAFSTSDVRDPPFTSQQQIAHARGNTVYNYNSCNTDSCKLPELQSTYASNAFDYWQSGAGWHYIYLDTPPRMDGSEPNTLADLSIYTNRSVDATCTCSSATANVERIDQTNATWTFQSNGSAIVPPVTIANTTTFAVEQFYTSCNGNRSVPVMAYETGDIAIGSTGQGVFYNCCSTVSEVANLGIQLEQMPTQMSRIAAGAIAWQGYQEDLVTSDQYSVYRMDTFFGAPQEGSSTSMAILISQFSIGVFVASGFLNPMLSITSDQPQHASLMKISEEGLLIMTLALIAGVQLLCLFVSLAVTYRVVIPDGSPLSISHKLAPLLRELEGQGTVMDAADLAKALGDPHIIYQSVARKREAQAPRALFVASNPSASTKPSRWWWHRFWDRLFRKSFADGLYA